MIGTRYPRPCPLPGHPQDEDEPALAAESAWSRLRAWHLHAPAERLPLPVIADRLALGLDLARRTRARPRPHLRRVAAAVASWLTWHRHERDLPAPAAAPDRGRSCRCGHRRLGRRRCHLGAGRLARAPAYLDLPRWLDRRVRLAAPARGGPRCPPAPRGRSRLGGAESRLAPDRAPDRPGRLPPAEGHQDAASVRNCCSPARPAASWPPASAANSRRYAEKFAHLRACPTAGSTSGSPTTPASWSSRSGRRTRRSAARSPTRRWIRTRRSKTGSRSTAASATRSPSG